MFVKIVRHIRHVTLTPIHVCDFSPRLVFVIQTDYVLCEVRTEVEETVYKIETIS